MDKILKKIFMFGVILLFFIVPILIFELIDKILYPGVDGKWQRECIEDNHCKEGLTRYIDGKLIVISKETCLENHLIWLEDRSMCETNPDMYCSYEKGCWDSNNHRCVYNDKELCIKRQKEICLGHNGQWLENVKSCYYR